MKKILIKNLVCGAKTKLVKFDQRKPFVDEFVELSHKQKYIYGLQTQLLVYICFYCSLM